MPAWLADLLAPLIEKIGATVIGDIVAWIKGLISTQEQQNVDNKDVAAEGSAAASGDLNAIAKDGQAALNGDTLPPAS